MKTKNALTVRPTPALSELKRARDLIRITERILGKSIAPGHNRTDEHGRKQGHWVERFAIGFGGDFVEEGPYVDGERHGHWVKRWAGTVREGPYVNGKMHGHWVERWSVGSVCEGTYVDGKRHGHWVGRFASGNVDEGAYVDGKEHGRWVVRTPDGTEWTINWRHGEIVE